MTEKQPCAEPAGCDEGKGADGLLVLDKVRKWIGPVILFREIDLEVRRGEAVALLGPSRSGKTHLLRVASGLTGITGGRILMEGIPVTASRRGALRRTGFMPKPPGRPETVPRQGMQRRRPRAMGVFPHTTVREDLEFFAACLRIPGRRRHRLISDVLALVDLADGAGKRTEDLPYSEAAKLFFARVVLHNPDLLLLDDPLPAFTGNLPEFWGVIGELKKMGKGILLTAADPAPLAEGPDRIAVLYGGKIIDSGKPADVLERVRTAGWPPPVKMFGGIRALLPQKAPARFPRLGARGS